MRYLEHAVAIDSNIKGTMLKTAYKNSYLNYMLSISSIELAH